MEKFKTLELVKSYKRKIGICSRDFGVTDCNFYAISYGNKVIAESDIDVIGFYENLPNPVIPHTFALMNILDIHGFDGLTIATTIDQALALSQVVGKHPKVFYLWDLEFLRPQNRNFIYNLQTYRNPNLKIVCRSEEHAKAFRNYSNRSEDSIIEDFNLFEFYKQFGVDNEKNK